MLFKTRGVVFSYIKFKETSIIAKVFTEDFGLQSYVVNGIRSSKGHSRIALYQPLTLLDMVVYKNDQKTIQCISECKCDFPFKTITRDMRKSAVAMFWSELLNKTIRDEGLEDVEKFNFIRDSLISLDMASQGVENYPLIFGLNFCRHLGFGMEDARTVIDEFGSNHSQESDVLAAYIDSILDGTEIHKCAPDLRRRALNYLVSYYQLHHDGFSKMKSVDILKQVFS